MLAVDDRAATAEAAWTRCSQAGHPTPHASRSATVHHVHARKLTARRSLLLLCLDLVFLSVGHSRVYQILLRSSVSEHEISERRIQEDRVENVYADFFVSFLESEHVLQVLAQIFQHQMVS